MEKKKKYSNNTFNSNIARKVINDTGKIIKKQVEVSPRKNEIIKSAKKPFKLTYTNFLENKNSTSNFNTNQIINKKTEEKINSNANNKINLLNRFNHQNKINRNSNNSRDSRNKNSGNNNGTDSKLTAVKITQIKNGNSSRNNSRGNSVNKNKSLSRNENIVTNTKIITKTTSEMKFNQNQNEGDQNLNLEEILKKQSYQSNTDLDIEEIIKNASNNQNEQINNNNLNLDALFNQQGNTQLDDEYINKIFESTEKLARNSNDITNNNNPLFLSQQIKPIQIKDMTHLDDKYISSYNSTQRKVDFVPSQLNNNF